MRNLNIISIFKEIRYAPKYFLTIRNFKTYIKNYLGLIKSSEFLLINLRNDISILIRPGGSDYVPINNALVRNCFFIDRNDIKQSKYIIDIGAHIGVFSLYCASLAPMAKILAFEPEPTNYKLLSRNILLNKMDGRIIPSTMAVGGTKGNVTFFVHEASIGHSTISDFEEHKIAEKPKALKVKMTTLKDILEDNNIKQCDFLKINAEGSEYDLLMKSDVSTLQKIKCVSAQCHFINNNLNRATLEKFLVANGFEMMHLQGDRLMALRKNSSYL